MDERKNRPENPRPRPGFFPEPSSSATRKALSSTPELEDARYTLHARNSESQRGSLTNRTALSTVAQPGCPGAFSQGARMGEENMEDAAARITKRHVNPTPNNNGGDSTVESCREHTEHSRLFISARASRLTLERC